MLKRIKPEFHQIGIGGGNHGFAEIFVQPVSNLSIHGESCTDISAVLRNELNVTFIIVPHHAVRLVELIIRPFDRCSIGTEQRVVFCGGKAVEVLPRNHYGQYGCRHQ